MMTRGHRNWATAGVAGIAAVLASSLLSAGVASAAPVPHSQYSEINATAGSDGDNFGAATAVSASTTVVGAPNTNGGEGTVYVFTKTANVWTQSTSFTAPDAATGDNFGASVAAFGSTVVVGAPGNNGNAGSIYIFTRYGGLHGFWGYPEEINGVDEAFFGSSVAMTSQTIVVGAPNDSDNGTEANTGAAYVYHDHLGTWTQSARLLPSDGTGGAQFGASVSASGSLVAVGAPWQAGRGEAYEYASSNLGWIQVNSFIAADAATGDQYGRAVAVTGTTTVVGAPAHNGTGEAYVYSYNGSSWPLATEFTGLDSASGDDFGYSVAAEGSIVLVGAPGHNYSTGEAYEFLGLAGSWSQVAAFSAADPGYYANFGSSTALAGAAAFVGSTNHNGTGSAYTFGL